MPASICKILTGRQRPWNGTLDRNYSGQAVMQTRIFLDQCAGILCQPHLYFESAADRLDFSDGAVFVLIMAALQAALSGLGIGASAYTASLGGLLLTPLAALVATFIGAAIILLLSKGLSGVGDFGDAFSIAAASSAMLPVGQLLTTLPVIGQVLAIAWAWFIVSRGAIHVFKVPPQTASAAFAVVYAVLLLLAVA